MTGSQSPKGWKGAITALERHYLPNCKQASLLSLLGVLDSHHPPDKGRQRYTQNTEQQGKAISRSDRARHTPEPLGPGKGTKRRPNQICASEGYLRADLSGLDQGGACSLGLASDGSWQSNVEPEQCAPCAGACPVGLRHGEHTPVLFVCSIPPSPQCD